MSNHCKIEFYFKRKDMEKLLSENPDAKGIIVRQEIKPRKNADEKSFTNVTTITAYATGSSSKSTVENDNIPIIGCPSPPGCEDEMI